MFQVELIPTLSHCIESTAKKEYQQSVFRYQRSGASGDLFQKIMLLQAFLEAANFRELRRQSEEHLVQGKEVKFVIYWDEGKPKYEMKVA